MALPTVVAAGAYAEGTADIVPGLPAGWAADDIHVLFVEQSAVNDEGVDPTGYTQIGAYTRPASTATDPGMTIYWRRAVAGDGNPTVPDTVNHTSAIIVGVRGCITTGDPFDAFFHSTENVIDTTYSVTGLTTTVVDCLVLGVAMHGIDALGADQFSALANADLGSLAEIAGTDRSTALGNGGGFVVFSGTKAAIGAFGASTLTGPNGTKAMSHIAFRPPVGADVRPSGLLVVNQALDRASNY